MATLPPRTRERSGSVPRGLLLCGVLAALITGFVSCDACSSGTPTSPRGRSEACLERAVFGEPAESLYVLPYPVGETYEVLQSYCTEAPRSHNTLLAYDFTMPMDAEVVAARAGQVFRVEDGFVDNGDEGAGVNYIRVRHSDSSVALYSHLRQGSAVVQVGDAVTAGRLLARAGSSGTWVPCSTCAVLHFEVTGVGSAVNFRNTDGPLDDRGGLIEGELYTALPY